MHPAVVRAPACRPVSVSLTVCGAIFACAADASDDVEAEAAFQEASDELLVPVEASACAESDACPAMSQVRPQCTAAGAGVSFPYDAAQTFTVSRTGVYDFVRVAVRRFGAKAALLKVAVREPTGGPDTFASAPVRATGLLASSLIADVTGLLPVHFTSPATLTASTPYVLVFTLSPGSGVVGVGCAEEAGGEFERRGVGASALGGGGPRLHVRPSEGPRARPVLRDRRLDDGAGDAFRHGRRDV